MNEVIMPAWACFSDGNSLKSTSHQVVEVDGGAGEMRRDHVQHGVAYVTGVAIQPQVVAVVVHRVRGVILSPTHIHNSLEQSDNTHPQLLRKIGQHTSTTP